MKLFYNVTGSQRKSLVKTISTFLNAPSNYLGAPTFAYEVGEYNIDKTGTVTGKDNFGLEDALRQAGFEAEIFAGTDIPSYGSLRMTEEEELGLGRQLRDAIGENGMSADDVPDSITIELPAANISEDVLRALLQSKAALITAALGEDAWWYYPESEYSPENPGGWYGPVPRENILPIEFQDGKVKFEWLKFGADNETVQAWSAFLSAAIRTAKKQKRVTAKDIQTNNPRYSFRCFLLKLGFIGDEYKETRKILLSNLSGNSAFSGKCKKDNVGG